MAVVTLTELRARVRQRTDQGTESSGGPISTTELDLLINTGKRYVDDLIVRAYGEDYSATSVTFLTTVSTENLSLSVLTAGRFYKSLAVSVSVAGIGWRDVKPYTLRERNVLRSVVTPILEEGTPFKYRVLGDNLSFLPAPRDSTTRCELLWIPQSTTLVSGGNESYDDVNGWSQLAVLKACYAIKDKLEEDTNALAGEIAQEEQRIMSSAPNRDAGEPARVQDVHGIIEAPLFYDPRFGPWWPR